MKIIYTIAGTYRPAGMERVLANKANALAAAGHELVIVTTDQLGREPAFPLAPGIRCIDLGIGYEDNNGGSFIDKLIHYPAKQRAHRRKLTDVLMAEKADIVMSMFCGDERFITGIKDGSRKMLEIHFSRYKRLQYGRKGIWALADRFRNRQDLKVARRFERFVVLTEEDRGYWEADAIAAGKPMTNLRVIPNARTFRCDSPAPLDGHTVIAVGRYSAQKHLDALLEAWKDAEKGDWKLRLVGDGEEREALEAKAAELGISESVIFGKSEGDIRDIYHGASILALSSHYEGLPMVLLEAQATGLPIVSFECKCGPRDVISDGVDGFLVAQDDTTVFAARLSELMADKSLRERMGAAAYKASERFDETRIMKCWTDLFEGKD